MKDVHRGGRVESKVDKGWYAEDLHIRSRDAACDFLNRV